MKNLLFTLLFVVLVWSACSIADDKHVELQWLGHSAFKITSLTKKIILIDPFLTNNPKTPAKLKQFPLYENVDVILVTHAHGDHLGDAVVLANKYKIPVYVPPGLGETLLSLGLLPANLLRRINKGGGVFPLGPEIEITMTHAEHSSEFKYLNPETQKTEIHVGGEPVGYIIRLENGFTLYHMGDTAIFGDMQFISNYYRPELILIPIGGNFVMDPEDAAFAVKEYLNPKYLIPMHYGTTPLLTGNVMEFKAALKGAASWVLDMVPGDVIKF